MQLAICDGHSTCSPSSPTASKSSFASRARGTIWSMPCSRSKAGRSPPDRPPRRGARQIPRHRRRQEPARRHQARRQHPAHRGEEGRARICRRARPAVLSPGRGMGARQGDRRRQGGGLRRRRARGFRRRHARDGEAAPARRCLLRQGDGQRRRRRRQGQAAREPAAAAQRNPRGDPRGRGFLAASRGEAASLRCRAVAKTEGCSSDTKAVVPSESAGPMLQRFRCEMGPRFRTRTRGLPEFSSRIKWPEWETSASADDTG